LIDGHANLELTGAKLKDPHSDAGGPSIDPELQLRLLPVGYLYGVTSETKLMGKSSCASGVHWFTGASVRRFRRLGFPSGILAFTNTVLHLVTALELA
jgi:hypothetical protein